MRGGVRLWPLRETFEIDTELTRDAIYAGIWTRLCSAMRGPSEDARLDAYIERFAVSRGQPTELSELFKYLDEDIDSLTKARRELGAVEATPLGSLVHLDDVHRFMPKACHEKANRWLWTDGEVWDVESQGGEVVMVRQFGTNEQLRGDRSQHSDRW